MLENLQEEKWVKIAEDCRPQQKFVNSKIYTKPNSRIENMQQKILNC